MRVKKKKRILVRVEHDMTRERDVQATVILEMVSQS